jgi:hypothetical protein
MDAHVGSNGGHDLIHWVAAAVLVAGGIVAVGLSAWAGRSRGGRGGGRLTAAAGAVEAATVIPHGATHAIILAGVSACAGFIHLAAAPGHFADLGDIASGFVAAGAFQLAWGYAALGGRHRPMSRRLRAAGIVGNAAIIGTWLVARTAGVPIGHVDPIALPDAAATTFEVLVVIGLAAALIPAPLQRFAGGRAVATLAPLAIVPVLGLAIVVTSLAALVIAAGADHGPPADGPAHSARSGLGARPEVGGEHVLARFG